MEQKTAYARKTGELLESLNVRFLNGRRDVKLEAKCQPCHLNRQRLNPSILSKDNVGVDQKKGLLYSICSSFLLDITYNLMIRITIHIMKQEQSRKDPIITMYRRIDFVSSSISPQMCLQKGRKMFLIPPSFFLKQSTGWFNLWQPKSRSMETWRHQGVRQKASHQLPTWGLQRGKKGELDCVTNHWVENVHCHFVSAGRGLADIALGERRFQSPLKWNYGALHSSLAFQRSQQYTRKGRRRRQLEARTDTQTSDAHTLTVSALYRRFVLPVFI